MIVHYFLDGRILKIALCWFIWYLFYPPFGNSHGSSVSVCFLRAWNGNHLANPPFPRRKRSRSRIPYSIPPRVEKTKCEISILPCVLIHYISREEFSLYPAKVGTRRDSGFQSETEPQDIREMLPKWRFPKSWGYPPVIIHFMFGFSMK